MIFFNQKDRKSRLRREQVSFFKNFQPGTPARCQVTLGNCVYSGQGGDMISNEISFQTHSKALYPQTRQQASKPPSLLLMLHVFLVCCYRAKDEIGPNFRLDPVDALEE